MIRNDYKWLTDIFVAHRGLFDNEAGIPENCVPAFEKASAHGYGIETDVQMTKDGVLVVFHDNTLTRMTGIERELSDCTLAELREIKLLNTDYTIPTFEEFLQAANGANLVVEIKDHKNIGEVEQKTYDMLKGYKGNYCIESFNPFIIRWFKLHAPEVIRGTLACAFDGDKGLRKWLLSKLKLCKWNGSQFIAYDANTLTTNKAVAKFAKRVPILCWTVRSQEEYDRLHEHFDNIIFDSFIPVGMGPAER